MVDTMKKIKIFIMTLIVMSILSVSLSFAEGLSSMSISQYVIDDHQIIVYFDITDEKGVHVPIKELDVAFKIKSLTEEELPSSVSNLGQYDQAKEGTGVILLVDVSDSVKNFEDMKSSMLTFVKQINPQDSVAVMTFGDSVSLIQEFTKDQGQLETAINGIKANEDWTKLYTGLISAESYCRGVYGHVPDKRAIVLFSDGYDYNTGGETKMDVITELRRSKAYPIYALQFDPGSDKQKKIMIQSLGDIIDMSNGQFVTLAGSTIKESYETIFRDIENEYVAVLQGNLEAGKYVIEMTTIVNQVEIYDDIEININKPITAKLPEATPEGQAAEDELLPSEEGNELSSSETPEDTVADEQVETDLEKDTPSTTQSDEDAQKDATKAEGLSRINFVLLIAMVMFTFLIIFLIIVLLVTRKRNIKQPITMSRDMETKAITLKPFHSNAFNPIVHNLGAHTILGKNIKKADIYIDFDPQVLDEHLILSLMNGYLYISKAVPQADLFINGLPVDNKRELRTGDIISFADIEMVISF